MNQPAKMTCLCPRDITGMRRLLGRQGMVLVEAEPGDAEGRVLRGILAALGTVQSHDWRGQRVWDVLYDQAAADIGGTRSLTMRSFPFHTDASFEEPPPRYIALYVVQEDGLGGGVTLLVESAAVLAQISSETRRTLAATEFRFRVPAEFAKGSPYRDACILLGDGLLRYRREVIDESRCSHAQRTALEELDAAIARVEPARLFLRSGMILLLDNARFLHARTEVHDPRRHLLRMRFLLRNGVTREPACEP